MPIIHRSYDYGDGSNQPSWRLKSRCYLAPSRGCRGELDLAATSWPNPRLPLRKHAVQTRESRAIVGRTEQHLGTGAGRGGGGRGRWELIPGRGTFVGNLARPWSRRRWRRRGEMEQTIVQIPPYFMITHVQTALRKAGNYDKTGRARENTSALFVYTRGWGGGGAPRDGDTRRGDDTVRNARVFRVIAFWMTRDFRLATDRHPAPGATGSSRRGNVGQGDR